MQHIADVNGYYFSFGHWLLIPDSAAATVSYLHDLASSYQLNVGGELLDCMHDGSSFATSRLGLQSPAPLQYTQAWPANHGAWTGGEANAIATGVYVLTSAGGKGSGARVRIPGAPDIHVDAGGRLSNAGRGHLQAFCTALITWVDGETGPTGAPILLGTVQRQRAGAPLPVASFDPAVGVLPSLRVERLVRRLPKPGQVSPT